MDLIGGKDGSQIDWSVAEGYRQGMKRSIGTPEGDYTVVTSMPMFALLIRVH